MRVYVIRHGLSEANSRGVIQGFRDSPLSSVGRKQADLLGRYFQRQGIHPERVYSSPLKRAHQTAECISRTLDRPPPIEKVEAFKEINVGSISGLPLEEAYAKYPDGWAADVNRWLDFSAFGGESFEEFFERVGSAAHGILSEWGDLLADRTMFFVVHAGVMRPLLKTLLDARSDCMYFSFGNCSFVEILYREVRSKVRKVILQVLQIDRVAALMGEYPPAVQDDDRVGSRL